MKNEILTGPALETVKTTGGWTKFRGEWMASLPEAFDDANITIEGRKVIGGGIEDQKVKYAILENRSGKKTIVELAEYEHQFDNKWGTSHIYSIRMSFEVKEVA